MVDDTQSNTERQQPLRVPDGPGRWFRDDELLAIKAAAWAEGHEDSCFIPHGCPHHDNPYLPIEAWCGRSYKGLVHDAHDHTGPNGRVFRCSGRRYEV